ncbi:unnamed protein product (macronuclear) [Paramecium tetraurelia]|uniref:C2 NT-type domain-containing protein n=1 Tax=Paramecium tetraurelia TaxID=5888 RepID=A0DV39_PARTE|nr:uncharacterized protein GSPATT00020568001 [Paramecium tetraurelia]CAK86906.1 unnamed protein product [Paramecium tetraurelia]|eukprot:XP_001454303.1 hypothetical protein (macronuclear) [Paramecium tetraurelia strain d4-2]
MKAFRYQVTLNISKVELSVKFPCTLQVMWKRGLNKCLTRTKEKTRNIFIVNEVLTLDFNVGENTQKKTHLIALLNVDGQSKLAGVVNFNINETMPIEGQCALNLERSPDPNAKIHFTYQVVNLGETDLSDSRASESFHQKTLAESFGFEKENLIHHKILSQKKSSTQLISTYEVQLTKELYEKSLKDLDQQKIKNSQLQDQLNQLQNEKSTYNDEVNKLKKQIIQLKNENQYLEEQYESSKQEITKFKESAHQHNQLQVQTEKLKNEIENYKIQNSVLENKYQQAFKKAKQLEEKVQFSHFNKIERSTNTQFSEIPEYVQQNTQITQLEEQVNEYKRKNDKLTYELQFTNNKFKTLEQELSQFKCQVIQYQTQLTQFKDQCNRYETENAKLKILIKQLEQDQNNKEKVQNRSQSDYQKQIDSLKDQLKQNTDKLEQVKEKYRLAKEKIEKQNDIIEQQNDELTMQNMTFLKELQLIAKRQEQFGIV